MDIQNLLGIDYVYFFRQSWRVTQFPAKLILKLNISQKLTTGAFYLELKDGVLIWEAPSICKKKKILSFKETTK